MSGKIEISRKLAERVLAKLEQADYSWNVNDPEQELRALLAAPVVERKPPIAYMRNEGTPNNLVKCTFLCEGAFGVYREPPAPVAVTLPDRMGYHRFGQVLTVSNAHVDGWNACLDKVKEMNQ